MLFKGVHGRPADLRLAADPRRRAVPPAATAGTLRHLPAGGRRRPGRGRIPALRLRSRDRHGRPHPRPAAHRTGTDPPPGRPQGRGTGRRPPGGARRARAAPHLGGRPAGTLDLRHLPRSPPLPDDAPPALAPALRAVRRPVLRRGLTHRHVHTIAWFRHLTDGGPMYFHSGATRGQQAFPGFRPATGTALAAVCTRRFRAHDPFVATAYEVLAGEQPGPPGADGTHRAGAGQPWPFVTPAARGQGCRRAPKGPGPGASADTGSAHRRASP